MSILTSLLSLLGNNNLVPAVIPSLAFVMTTLVVFDPIVKSSSLLQQQNGVDYIVLFSIFIVLPVIILSYTLTALNPYLLKLFEGYVFFDRFPFMYKSQIRKAQKLLFERDSLKEQIQMLEKRKSKLKKAEVARRLFQLRQKYYAVVSAYDLNYPDDPTEIMPTRIGNILKASQTYAGTRYGIDGVAFWPRLVHVIPKEYKETIDASRNELSFLFNFATLSIIFYILCIMAIFIEMPHYHPSILFRFIIAGALALLCNWFFSRASTFSVQSYGMLFRSAYDLFRLDLLEQFRVEIPQNSAEEFFVWKNINELILMGQSSLEFRPIEYDTKGVRTKDKANKTTNMKQ